MHFCVFVIGAKNADDVEKAMEPFYMCDGCEDRDNAEHVAKHKYDWYQVGGRWSDLGEYTTRKGLIGRIPFAILSADGEWFEKDDSNWRDEAVRKQNEEDWQLKTSQLLDNLDDDTPITVVDCHE